MINICVPVLRRYDLLRKMIESCLQSEVKPDNYYIIDNGRSESNLLAALGDFDILIKVLTPPEPMSVAASWNWFITHVPEERFIVNDDITFARHSIGAMVACPADLVWGSGFSCFILRDAAVQKLGLFDESLSPGYAYYEDDDYLQRLDGKGTKPRRATAENVECGIFHFKSGTLKAASHEETLKHHERFKAAQGRYVEKWGLQEVFK